MTQGTTCEHCGRDMVPMPVPPFHYCDNCTARLNAVRLPIVAWATRVIENLAELHGDHDRDWLHA